MSEATIPLAKGYNEKHVPSTGWVSEKLDGVPVKITVKDGEVLECVSRQGKDLLSCRWIADAIAVYMSRTDVAVTFVGELLDTDVKGFKNVSGVVRRQEPQHTLYLNLFDMNTEGCEKLPFTARIMALFELQFPESVKVIKQYHYDNGVTGLQMVIRMLDALLPKDKEGLIIRDSAAEFKPGTRHWDYMKYVLDPTMDLKVVGFDEAVSKYGEPLGMVGRINCDYKGKTVGVGPGKLTHEERGELWRGYALNMDTDALPLACVKYKRDPQYDALRQPTFQHWREDKAEPSYE